MVTQKTLKNIDRRYKSAMATILSAFEHNFPREHSSDLGMKFKGLVKNAINDSIRACRDELLDSSGIDSSDSRIKFSADMVSLLSQIEFIFNTNGRSMMLRTAKENSEIIHNIYEEIGCGIIHFVDGNCNYVISGIDSIVNDAVPFFDNYPFTSEQKSNYLQWRQWVVAFYERI